MNHDQKNKLQEKIGWFKFCDFVISWTDYWLTNSHGTKLSAFKGILRLLIDCLKKFSEMFSIILVKSIFY